MQGQFFKREHSGLPGAAKGGKGFGTHCGEAIVFKLHAQHTLPRAHWRGDGGVAGVDAHIVARVLKRGARFAAVVFGVLVVAMAGAQLQAFNPAAECVGIPLQCIACAFHADGDVIFGHRAVIGLVSAGRKPQAAVAAKPSDPQRRAACRGRRIANGFGHGGGTNLGTGLVLGYCRVARAAGKGIGVQGKTLRACLQQDSPCALAVSRRRAQMHFASKATLGIKQGLLGDAVVHHIHHAPHGAAAIHQSARSAQDFNALHRNRVAGHGVVKTVACGIHHRTTVLQHAHAVAVQPTYRRAARIGAEVAAAHAGCAIQRFSQCGLGTQFQCGARQYISGRYQVCST